jgi:hypothetical protein
MNCNNDAINDRADEFQEAIETALEDFKLARATHLAVSEENKSTAIEVYDAVIDRISAIVRVYGKSD